MGRIFTAYVEFDPETNLYVAIVPGVPGAHTEGATLDELRENLKEVLELCQDEGVLPSIMLAGDFPILIESPGHE